MRINPAMSFSHRLAFVGLIPLLALGLPLSAPGAAPIVSEDIADLDLFVDTPANEIDLNTKFSDPDLPANTRRWLESSALAARLRRESA